MENKYNGGPAFLTTPSIRYHENGRVDLEHLHTGLSVRDWFAGQALAGMSAVPDTRTFPNPADEYELSAWRENLMGVDAAWCYAMADAMLAERDK